MGWCSATEIMDTALDAATAAVAAMWQVASGNENVRTPAYANDLAAQPALQAKLDNALRPFVTTLAGNLHELDWDCEEESRYFLRFPQEMLGFSDSEYRAWLVERVKDSEGDQQWVAMLGQINAKTGAQTSGR